ncbi:uncharacterized protein LOC113312232 [Papaver somniferum]|uniref:uncharacterized protein LOC113312232 n=1 Tax=Papaver somniferum TaxID=3469 RepID=UPI000E6F9249|nr:uncharacterized protein LOC113312232 [Papaver somniferum]
MDNLGTLQLTQTWHKYGSCPAGTIPIRRKGKNYNPALLRKHNYPRLSPYKSSVTSRSNDTADDSTEDSGVHEADEYTGTGCYNLLCDGFVHTTSNVSVGCSFSDVSTFNGSQKDVTFSIHKDQSSGHWWVQLQGIPTGYYPSSLFDGLSKEATRVDWGGQIIDRNEERHTSTQMGSGHFPSEGGLKTSSYFNWVQVVDETNMMKDPENVKTYIMNPNCYDLKIDNGNYDTNGYTFYYGGPGYNDICQ